MLNERAIVANRNMVLPYEHGCKTHHLVLDVEDMLRIRARITEHYFNQKVFVSPCLSKLYFSTNVNLDGTCRDKETPSWLYFGTGAMAVIYDTAKNEVKLALFDRNDVRLLWCLKWTKYIRIENINGNFHMINTEADGVNQVGVLYENDNVADVIAQTVTLIYSSVQMTIIATNENNKSKLRQCLSSPVGKAITNPDHNANRSALRDSIKRNTTKTSCQLPMTRGERSATVHEFPSRAVRKIQMQMEERPKSECSDSRLVRLSRADSFRRNRSQSLVQNRENDSDKQGRKASGEDNNKIKDSILKALFKKRRISRTQSLKVEDEACSNGDSKQFERAIKLVKPRASTDTMLLKGDSMRYVIETGLSARNARERRQWVKTLSNEEMPSTDLCVTEL